MEFRVEWSSGSQKDLAHLDRAVAQRILKKMKWFFEQADPLKFATRLQHPSIGDARFRIGDYRVIVGVDAEQQVIVIIAIGHRRDIYRR